MTTVCTDGHTMAADRLVNGDGLKHCYITKVYRLSDGRIVGHTGTAFQVAAFCTWLEGDQAEPFEPGGDMEALVLAPDGTLRCYNGMGRSFACEAPQAIGSGCAVAYGALDAGMSPERAVEIAAGRDLFTGGGVDVLSRTQ